MCYYAKQPCTARPNNQTQIKELAIMPYKSSEINMHHKFFLVLLTAYNNSTFVIQRTQGILTNSLSNHQQTHDYEK